MGIFGIILWAGGYAFDHIGGSGSVFGGLGDVGSRKWLGVVLALAFAAIGYLLAISARRGPMATAGVTAAAVAVPVALGFLTLGDGNDPVNIDATVLISIAVWLISYFVVPGTRGHSVLLGLAAYEFWAYLVDKIALNSLINHAFTGFADGNTPSLANLNNDLDKIAAVSIVMGAVYYLIAFGLDRRGYGGAAIGFVFAAFPALAGGIAFAAHSFGQAGTGFVLVFVGMLLCGYGAKFGRRFTTWIWAAASVLGVGILIADAAPNNTTTAGIAFLVVGAVFVILGVAASSAISEREYPQG